MNGKQFINDIEDLVEVKLKPVERIQSVRRILDKLFRDLTKKYPVVMTTLQPRMAYYCQQERIDKATTELLNELRIFSNKVVHNEISDPTENNEKLCVKILSEFVSTAFKTELTEEIKKFYQDEKNFSPLLRRKARKYEEISELHGFIKRFSKQIVKDRFDKEFIDMFIESDDLGEISIRLTKTDEEDLIIETVNTAWEYAEIIITDVLYQAEFGHYYSTPKTLLILEPNFIIDVKQIAECHEFIGAGKWDTDPSTYQRKKFDEPIINESITKGYLL